MKRLAFLAVVACLCGCALPGTGRAGMITYTEQFTATGTLGTKIFTDEMVTITGIGDTANLIQLGGNFLDPVTATVTIAGIGTANFTDGIRAESRTITHDAGFIDLPANDRISTSNSFFAGYELTTSIDPPLSGNMALRNATNVGMGTDEGTLTFSSFGATSTFGATLSPEPASLTLLGIGAAGLLGYGWRRKRAAA